VSGRRIGQVLLETGQKRVGRAGLDAEHAFRR
jgi:hypothetical protein